MWLPGEAGSLSSPAAAPTVLPLDAARGFALLQAQPLNLFRTQCAAALLFMYWLPVAF
jgi:hypothetical protein